MNQGSVNCCWKLLHGLVDLRATLGRLESRFLIER